MVGKNPTGKWNLPRFPEIGLPYLIIHFKPSSYWATPIYGNFHIPLTSSIDHRQKPYSYWTVLFTNLATELGHHLLKGLLPHLHCRRSRDRSPPTRPVPCAVSLGSQGAALGAPGGPNKKVATYGHSGHSYNW